MIFISVYASDVHVASPSHVTQLTLHMWA